MKLILAARRYGYLERLRRSRWCGDQAEQYGGKTESQHPPDQSIKRHFTFSTRPVYFRCFGLSSSNQLSTTTSSSGTLPGTCRIIRKRRSSGPTAYCAPRSSERYAPAGKRVVERPSENVGADCTSTATRFPATSR